MKIIATLMGILAPAAAFATANIPAENDGVFVWIFLGFFALIVIGQLIPAIMLIIGAIKGVRSKSRAETEDR